MNSPDRHGHQDPFELAEYGIWHQPISPYLPSITLAIKIEVNVRLGEVLRHVQSVGKSFNENVLFATLYAVHPSARPANFRVPRCDKEAAAFLRVLSVKTCILV